jgi:hypothetical protein
LLTALSTGLEAEEKKSAIGCTVTTRIGGAGQEPASLSDSKEPSISSRNSPLRFAGGAESRIEDANAG